MNKYKLNRANSINEIEKQRNILGTSHFFTDYIFFRKNSIYSSYLEGINYNKLFFKTRNYSYSFSDIVKKVLKQV